MGPFFSSWNRPALLLATLGFHIDWTFWPTNKQATVCRERKAREGGCSKKHDMFIYGGFLKWWYPTIMGFPTKNDHFGAFWGYPYFWKHPYGFMRMAGIQNNLWTSESRKKDYPITQFCPQCRYRWWTFKRKHIASWESWYWDWSVKKKQQESLNPLFTRSNDSVDSTNLRLCRSKKWLLQKVLVNKNHSIIIQSYAKLQNASS